MGNPVTITVNAETAQAAAAMQSLGTTGKESLKQLREGALLTREGFHGLESTVLLLGGTRFPMLAEGIIGIRSAMMGARTASMLTGVSLATIIPIIGGIAAAVGAGALAWGAIKSEQDRARESANQLAEAYKQMPELIGRINDAHRAGVISAADQQRMLTTLGVARPSSQNAFNAAVMLPGQQSGAGNAQPPLRLSTSQMGIPDHNDIRLTNEELVKLGVLLKQVDDKGNVSYTVNPQIEALQKLDELRKKIAVETLTGFDKERAAVGQKYEDEMTKLNEYVEAAGKKLDPAEAQKLRLGLATGLTNELAAIDKKQAEESLKCDEDTYRQLEENAKLHADWERKQQEQKTADFEFSRANLQGKVMDIQGNPFLSAQEKAALTEPLIQQLIQANQTRIAQLQTIAGSTTDAAASLEAQKQITQLVGEQAKLQNQMLKDSATGSFWGTYKQNLAQMKTQWGSMSADLANGSFRMINQGIQGMANALTSMIMGTKSAAQAFAEFGLSMLTSFIQMVLEMVLYAEVAIPILTALGVLSGGSIPATGAPATISAVGAGIAGVSALTFAARGADLRSGQPTIVGEEGWELFVPDTGGTVIPHDRSVQMLGGGRSGGAGSTGNGGRQQTKVLNVFDRQSMLEEMKKPDYGDLIVNHVMANKTRIGIQT